MSGSSVQSASSVVTGASREDVSIVQKPVPPTANGVGRFQRLLEHPDEPVCAPAVLCSAMAVDPVATRVVNEFLDARPPFTFRMSHDQLELRWHATAPASIAVMMDIACGAHRLTIALDGLAAIDPLLVGEPFSLLPGSLRNMVLQHRLAAFLAALPASISASAELRAVRWSAHEQWNCKCSIGFLLRRLPGGPESQGLLGTDSTATLQWLHEQLPLTQPVTHGAKDHIHAPLRIVLGSSAIEAAQLRGLEHGDLVWIEDAAVARKGFAVQLQGDRIDHRWPALLARNALQVTGTAEPYTAHVRVGDLSMSAEPSALQVPVVFDLGALHVPLGELECIQPGKTFELALDAARATVNLRVSGKCIAQGTLVVIGKRLGVRIQQVAWASRAPPANSEVK